MKPVNWPFRPDHISNDGDDFRFKGNAVAYQDLSRLKGVGIISNKYLQGLQTSICVNLQNPTTIIEFSLSGELIRTDSAVLPYALHPPCKVFRQNTNSIYCVQCDNEHAALFMGQKRTTIFRELNKKILRLKNKKSAISIEDNDLNYPNVRRKNNRVFIEYDCPFLGYRELVFPIYFENSIIGTFFVGELTLIDSLETISSIQNNQLNKLAGISEQTKVEIQKEHKKWISNHEHLLSSSNYELFISNTINEIKDLERTLVDQMNLQMERYVREVTEKRIQELNDDMPQAMDFPADNLKEFWDNVEHRLKDIIRDFALKYIVIFGPQNLANTGKNFSALALSGPELMRLKRNELSFDTSILNSLQGNIAQDDEKKILDHFTGFPKRLKPKLNRVRLFPKIDSKKINLVVLVGYNKWNPGNSNENKKNGYVDNSAITFYASVLSGLSSILATNAQQQMENNLRIFGHELGQLSSGLDWLRLFYFSDVDELLRLTPSKAEDIKKDLKSYIQLSSLLSHQAQMVQKSIDLHKVDINVYGDLLFKWRDIYRLEIDKKKLQTVIPHPAQIMSNSATIFADQKMMDQLVYNLFNNAIKYSFPGTKIHIFYKIENQSPTSWFKIIFTNYGKELLGESQIYDLYFRGDNTKNMDGLGIGLYIVKNIVELHGGEIHEKCEKVSDFNVPLIESYLQHEIWDPKLIQALKTEQDRLKRKRIYNNIIAISEKNQPRLIEKQFFSLMGYLDYLNQPTYKVTFTVMIPTKG